MQKTLFWQAFLADGGGVGSDFGFGSLAFSLDTSAILLIAWTLIFRPLITVLIVLFRTIPIAIAWPPTTWALLFWFVLVTYI